MSFKIKDGTRPTKRLCDSCRYSLIRKGPQQGQEEVDCMYGMEPRRLRFPVVECSIYQLKGALDEYQAEKIGWVLEVKGGKIMGFKQPKRHED